MNDQDDQEYDDRGEAGIQKHSGPTQQLSTIGGQQITQVNETSSVAMSAMARADIESRLALAKRFPRNLFDVRANLLRECERPGFALVARYRKPQGQKKNDATGRWEQNYIEGYSVRFAEAAVRSTPNLDLIMQSVYDDADQQILKVTLFDLETNTRTSTEVIVIKTVERRKLKDGQRPLSRRLNSFGDEVFILPATDDEIAQKRGALVSKARRNLVLQMIPGDILDDCEDQIATTLAKKDATDPEGEKKKILDAFAKLGVLPSAIDEYLGHPTGTLLPGDLADLRAAYATVKTGEASWKELLEARHAPPSDPANGANEKTKSRSAEVQAKVDARKAKLDAKSKQPAASGATGATGSAESTKATDKPAEKEHPKPVQEQQSPAQGGRH